MTTYRLHLNDYQVANLRAAIEATGYGTWDEKGSNHVPRNPIYVLNNGDWIGELYNMLPETAWKPNNTPQELADRAREWDRT